ncbi:MAG: Dabb family protein [Bacteroidales bacterium]
MVKHIVVWRLRDSAHGNTREQNAQIIKSKLESLSGKIPGMVKIEVGVNYSETADSADIVLYSEFETKSDLDSYQAHPEHKAIMPFVAEAKSERRMVDYEV